jgi:thiol-disulfide isomerase/thioredoxin
MRRGSTTGFAILLTLSTAHGLEARDAGDLKERLGRIVDAQAEARRRFSRDLEGKTTEEAQRPAVDRYVAEVVRNTDEVLDLVRVHPKDPSAVEALKFVILTARGGPGEQSYRAMEVLLRDHVRDPGMGEICGRMFSFGHAPVAEALIRAVVEKHPDRADRGLACHSLATYLKLRATMVRRIRGGRAKVEDYAHEPLRATTERLVKESDPEALDRESEALLERVVAEYADIKDWFTPHRTIGAIAEGELFAIRNLSAGQPAPEIRGKDHEGKSFALGDYRGRVVVLTFSASWCGPCVGMHPQERELVRKLEGQPFAILSVNADEDVSTLRKSIASGEITWRCWWDGGIDGPITTRWGISAIPATFVLDRAGVIRARDVRGAELEKVVGALLEENPASKQE